MKFSTSLSTSNMHIWQQQTSLVFQTPRTGIYKWKRMRTKKCGTLLAWVSLCGTRRGGNEKRQAIVLRSWTVVDIVSHLVLIISHKSILIIDDNYTFGYGRVSQWPTKRVALESAKRHDKLITKKGDTLKSIKVWFLGLTRNIMKL